MQIFHIDYINILYVFMVGMLLTILYKVEQFIESKAYKATKISELLVLLFAKSLLGGFIISGVFFSLEELHISFTMFGREFVFGSFTNILIASIFCLMGSDFFKFTQKIINKNGDKV